MFAKSSTAAGAQAESLFRIKVLFRIKKKKGKKYENFS